MVWKAHLSIPYKLNFSRGFWYTMRVAIYARVSTSAQSCDRQVSDLREFAANRRDEVVAEFCEKASGKKDDRAERRKLFELARQRKIDAILVTEMSRWGRNTSDLLDTLKELAQRKVSVVALSGKLDFDMSTAQGKLMVTLLAGLAEFERDLLAERVNSGLAHARSIGKVLGRPLGGKKSVSREQIISCLNSGKSIRGTALELDVSKTTVLKIAKEHRRASESA